MSSSVREFIPAASKVRDYVHPWIPDQGDGTYCNPILYADYSDPDMIRVGEDFYLTASSFNCTPGLPILHSKDLVNWSLINHAVKNLPHPRYAEVQAGCGIWAPAIRFHAGKFWIFFPLPDEGIYVTTAADPAGKWSEPHLLQAGRGLIDPCPLWDDDGKAYLAHAYAYSRSGIKHRIRICPMTPDALQLLGEGQIVFHDPERHPTIEGPKFLKRNGWYYLFAPAGGVETGWQLALRAKNIFGPYEAKIVLAQGDTAINGPHQGALVDTPDGTWWFAHFQDVGVYGRIVHLQPVKWENDWPIMGDHGEPVLRCSKPISATAQKRLAPQTSDEFDSATLGLQWQWPANHDGRWFELGRRRGWLRLHPQLESRDGPTRQPNLLLQKFPARGFGVETLLEFAPNEIGEEAGIIVIGKTFAALALEKTDSGFALVFRCGATRKVLNTQTPGIVKLRVNVSDGGWCRFSFAIGEQFADVGEPFCAERGVWIGAKLGLYSIKRNTGPAGHVDVDYFRFL